MKVAMLLLASGRGERLRASVPKAFVDVSGAPLVLRSARRLAEIRCPRRQIVLAVNPDDRDRFVQPIESELRSAGVELIVSGGATRQASMERAFAAADADLDLILVHDAARPFFDPNLATKALEHVQDVGGGAVLASRVTDTLKLATSNLDVERTVDRSSMWAAQTPQVVARDSLEQAIETATNAGFEATDDVSLLEHANFPVKVIESTARNLKVTSPADLALAAYYADLES